MNQNPQTLYDCLSVLVQCDEIAAANDGEMPEDAEAAIVAAHTTSMEKLGSLLGYIKYLEGQELICKTEIDRIQARKKATTNRLKSIKQYLLPYVIERGKTTVGTITLSTRKSQKIELEEDFNDPLYCKQEVVVKPDKKKIKEFLKENPDMTIKGAELITKQNLSIK